jgi:solute carrier family 35, member E1
LQFWSSQHLQTMGGNCQSKDEDTTDTASSSTDPTLEEKVAPKDNIVKESIPAEVVMPTVSTKKSETIAEPANSSASLQLFFLFVVWYTFNAAYNVYNQYLKNDLPLPYAVSTLQLVVGMAYALPLWALNIRKVPNLNFMDLVKILPIVIFNAAGHLFAVIAMFEKGGGSFTHVIKASEPVVSVFFGFIILQTVPRPFTFMSLLPITYGVAYASTLGNLNIETMSKELTTKAALMAMGSNIAFALRSILRKIIIDDKFKTRTELDACNDHAVTSLLGFLLMIPVVSFCEGWQLSFDAYNKLVGDARTSFQVNAFICGMTWYLYNEMQNKVLASLGPVPTAVGNTLKRVAIFVALYFFIPGESFPLPKVVGCVVAVGGCLLYAVMDAKKW